MPRTFTLASAVLLAASLLPSVSAQAGGAILYDGRIGPNVPATDLAVATSATAKLFKQVVGEAKAVNTLAFTPISATEKGINIPISNSSIFVPGGSGPGQLGFRRVELVANVDSATSQVGKVLYQFTVEKNACFPLALTHEIQMSFIENPADGNSVFKVVTGTGFSSDPAAARPSADSTKLRINDFGGKTLFSTDFTDGVAHNVGIQVDWDANTLAVFYSSGAGTALKQVVAAAPNVAGAAAIKGEGDFHWGVLQLPLPNPADSESQRGDVVNRGIQDIKTESLIYSNVLISKAKTGASTRRSSFSRLH